MDTMFKDQSQEITSKVQAEGQRSGGGFTKERRPRASPLPPERRPRQTFRFVSESPPMSHSPKLDPERGLIDYFANNFTAGGPPWKRHNLFWIPQNFDEVLANETARLSVQCTGAMALARQQKSPEYILRAHQKYSQALLSLAQAQRLDAEGTAKDAVFTSILLLSFFEILASYDDSSRQSWRTHLGGLEILFQRTKQQYMQGDFGARMFRQTRSQVIIHALQTSTLLPAVFEKQMYASADPVPPIFNHFDQADIVLMRLANLQARCQTDRCSDVLVRELYNLYQDASNWSFSLPATWSFSAQPNPYSGGLWWNARSDVYSAGFLAHTWNKVRAARIRIYDLIQDVTSQLQFIDPDVLATTPAAIPFSEIQELVVAIVATIPLYYRSPNLGAESGEEFKPPLAGIVFWFVWVLEVVGSMREAEPELTIWTAETFERMCEATGIVKAQLVADRLRAGYRWPILP